MTAQTISSFEQELKNKLSFKASSRISVDGLLFKTFKFFDLMNQGYVEKTDFCRAISKVGVVFNTPESIDIIFNHYDTTRTGKIYYKDFVDQILFRDAPSSGLAVEAADNRPMSASQVSTMSREALVQINPKTPEEVLELVRNKLLADSATGKSALLAMALRFKQGDTAKTHFINQSRLLNHLPILHKQHYQLISSLYQTNPQNEINYAQLIYSIRGPLSPQRRQLISSAFNRLFIGAPKQPGYQHQREVPIDYMLSQYSDSFRINKASLQEQARLYCNFQGIDDGIFTEEDFEDFISFVGFSFAQEEMFRNWIEGGFQDQFDRKSTRSSKSRRQFVPETTQVPHVNVSKPTLQVPSGQSFSKKPQPYKQTEISPIKKQPLDTAQHIGQLRKDAIKNKITPGYINLENIKQPSDSRSMRSSQHSELNEIELILRRMKRTLCSKGCRGYLQFENACKSLDYENNCKIDVTNFKKVIKQQRIDITEKEAVLVFEVFDQLGEGVLNYPEFVYTLRGQIPERRRQLINRVWQRVRQSEFETSHRHLKTLFKARAHPDVISGKRAEDDVISELVNTLYLVQDLNGVRTEEILYEDFIEYLENMSATIPDDALFDITLVNVWKLDSTFRIQEQYAGSKKIVKEGGNPYLRDHHKFLLQGGTSSQNAPFGTY